MALVVRVPASSANLGPGFDALGMALTLHAELGVVEPGGTVRDRARVEDERHPATVAFRRLGGEGPIWVRSPIPAGRGLGFSGAMRVGGLVLAHAQRHGADPADLAAARPALLAEAAALEGHADNVAASLMGGVVAVAGGRCVRVPLGLDPAVVVFVPGSTTSTDDSRRRLAEQVAFEDAVFNVGRTALLVAALAAGDVTALREATRDRLHQDRRLADAPLSRAALDALLAAGAWCAWLSGSGPTVAALCPWDGTEALVDALDRRARVLHIDREGAVVREDVTPPASG